MESKPSVYKCMLITDGHVAIMDVIKHGGRWWLVPNWLLDRAAGIQMPERIVALDRMSHTHHPGNRGWQFLLEYPAPKELFFGADPSQAGSQYEFHLMPDIRVPMHETLN